MTWMLGGDRTVAGRRTLTAVFTAAPARACLWPQTFINENSACMRRCFLCVCLSEIYYIYSRPSPFIYGHSQCSFQHIYILKTVHWSFILMKLSLLPWNSYHLSLYYYSATSAYLMCMKLSRNSTETGLLDQIVLLRPCLVHLKNQKVFKILCHIEFFGTYMKH